MFKPIEELIKSCFETYHKQPISISDMYVESIFHTWAKQYNITHYYNGAATWRKLFSLRAKWDPKDFVPFSDHTMLFKSGTGKLYFVSHDYSFVSEKHTELLIKWADERGLNVEILPNLSWHAPRMTTLLQFSRK